DRCLERDPELRFASAEDVLDVLEGTSEPSKLALLPAGNPYRGLQAFDREHRALFFGRAREVRAAVEKLRADPFLLIIGASGVGKSSLAAAGVLPALVQGALDDSRTWRVAQLKPGRSPFAALVALLAPILKDDEENLGRRLRTEPLGLARDVRRSLG